VNFFRSLCLCFHGLSVWKSFSAKCIGRLKLLIINALAYKNFFRCDSVTGISADLVLSAVIVYCVNGLQGCAYSFVT